MSSSQFATNVRRFTSFVTAAAACAVCVGQATAQTADAGNIHDPRAWLHRVRIGAYSLNKLDAEKIVDQANADHVYGIEVDNDITGRYESLLDPTDKLQAIEAVAEVAHQKKNKTFVYIAGLECISTNDAGPHTLAKEHPDWLQRKISGDPAIFGTASAFWIAKGDEDVWVSPYAPEWRRLYMKRVAQIAHTGIDGIYVDIPYWMTHFKGWEDSWASFDDATVAAFKQKTGLNAKRDIKIGDYDDPGFQKWVDFRIDTITEFLAEIRRTAIAVNPGIAIIPEIYPGIESDAPRVGPDVYQIYQVADAVAHEYEFGSGEDHTAAMRSTYDWMMYQIGMRSFRAFAGDKPTWMLNYSWDGAANVKPADAMQTMMNSELMAGTNVWDASGHVMSGSNNSAERRIIYSWIKAHESLLSAHQIPTGKIGVYFSDRTRNRYPEEFVDSYRGALLILLQEHRQFQIVTPGTLEAFKGNTLVLPDVRVLDAKEIAAVHHFAEAGGRVVITGRSNDVLNDLNQSVRLPDDPARKYVQAAEQDYAGTRPDEQVAFLNSIGPGTKDEIKVNAGRDVVVHASEVNGKTVLFLANFTGIKPGVEITPVMQANISVIIPAAAGTSMHVLPYLGKETVITGTKIGDRTSFSLPNLKLGAVVWFR